MTPKTIVTEKSKHPCCCLVKTPKPPTQYTKNKKHVGKSHVPFDINGSTPIRLLIQVGAFVCEVFLSIQNTTAIRRGNQDGT